MLSLGIFFLSLLFDSKVSVTTVSQGATWNLTDTRGPGGTVTFGAGTVFTEAHAAAASVGRAVASGWSPTVGLAGWTMGGGHGPFVPSFGLGADHLVEANVVLADATVVTASAVENSDLVRVVDSI